MKHMVNAGFGIVLLFTLMGIPAAAQTGSSSNSEPGQSLGDYAKQVRKAPEAKSKARVFDNDNLPKSDKLSIVGNATEPAQAAPEEKPAESKNAPQTAGSEAKPAAAASANPPADTSKMDQAAKDAALKQWADKLKSQHDAVDLLARELDVLQREYQVRAAAMYADAGNRMRNSADWDKQDAQYKQQIAEKQKALDDAKQKVEDLNEQARKAGVPSSVREP